jgi:hypothetical protein
MLLGVAAADHLGMRDSTAGAVPAEAARLRAELAVSSFRHAVVRALSRRVLERPPFAELLEQTVALLAEQLAPACVGVFKRDASGRLTLLSGRGWSDVVVGASIGCGVESHAHATLEGGDVTPGRFAVDDAFRTPPLFRAEGIVQGLAVALGDSADRFGLLGVYRTDAAPFREDDVHLLGIVGALLTADLRRRGADAACRAAGDRWRLMLERRLAAGVAHDLSNLSFALRGYAELAQQALTRGEDPADELAQVLAACARVDALSRGLRGFATPGVDEAPIDLNEALWNLERALVWLCGAEVDVQLISSQEPVPVLAARERLDEVIVNCALALSESAGRGGLLALEVSSAAVDGRRYGMLAASHTGAEAVDGFALSVAADAVAVCGGRLALAPDPGSGVTVAAYLPLAP